MKKILLLLMFIGAVRNVEAQQKPQYTQYVLNNLLLNPAVSGIENYIDLKAGYRNQWNGLEGAPVTSYLTLSAPIGSGLFGGDAATMSSGNISPYGSLYTQSYRAAEPHHGIGFTLVSDQAGPFTTTNVNATYAYHLGLSETLNLALGLGAGFNNTSINTSQLVLVDANDLTINNAGSSSWKPDLSAGLWAYSSDYYVGLSAQQLLPQNSYASVANSAYRQNRNYRQWFLTSGFKVFLSDDITMVPSALIKLIRPLPLAFDLNMKMAFQDRFWIGCSYRNQDSVAGLLGLNISSLINISYSYDYTTSALRTVSTGTHEIVIGLMLNNKYKVICPEHTF